MIKRERILVVGGDGLIGGALMRRLSSNHYEVLGTTRRSHMAVPNLILLDLRADVASWHPPENCSTVFLCAAITSQEACLLDTKATSQINVESTFAVAAKMVKAGAFVVFLSTNLVFDGSIAHTKPDHSTKPCSEYGRQKKLAEELLLGLGENVAVLRLSKVVHSGMPLLKKWTDALQKSQQINPLADLRCAPIPLNFVVEAMEQLGKTRLSGIFQISGERDISYAEIAMVLARKLNVNEQLVCPKTAKQLGLILDHVPAHTTLDTADIFTRLGMVVPSVVETLEQVMNDLICSSKNAST